MVLQSGCVPFDVVFGLEAAEDCAADFVGALFGCCFTVAFGLEATDPDAAARAGAPFFAVFGAEGFDVRLPFDAADVLFLCFLVICASFSGVFARSVPRDFSENAAQRVLRALLLGAAHGVRSELCSIGDAMLYHLRDIAAEHNGDLVVALRRAVEAECQVPPDVREPFLPELGAGRVGCLTEKGGRVDVVAGILYLHLSLHGRIFRLGIKIPSPNSKRNKFRFYKRTFLFRFSVTLSA